MFFRDFRAAQNRTQASRKYRSCGVSGLVLGLCLATACLGDNHSHAVVFVHATDPHIFIPAAQSSDKETKASGDRQEGLNQKALTDMLRRVQGLSGNGQAPAFLVITGDFGVEPCAISKSQPTPVSPAGGQNKAPAQTTPTSKQCVDSIDPAKRNDQIARLSKALATSPLKEIYLVAGNNDVANEDPDSVSLGYFNQFIDDLQKKLNDDKAGVQLHNLTACYAGGGSSSCYADIAGRYRLVGFPSYSFKNWDGKTTITANNDEQAKQFEMFRSLIEQAKQDGKSAIVLSHIPEIDDPYVLAQDRYAAVPTHPNDDPDSKNPRSPSSAWNITVKLLDGWKEILQSDTVAAVLAGHLHDSHKEIYRRPYVWSNVDDHRLGFRKLFLAPPLAVRNQDASPIQARGFSLVTLEPNHIEALLYWYDQETREFKSDATGFEHRQSAHFWWRIPRFITWTIRSMWQLDQSDGPLIRMGVLLIALLTAYLTVVAVWNIPETANPLAATADKPANGQKAPDTPTPTSSAAVASPFASNFGKTVIGGFTGLAVTEVAKAISGEAMGGEAPTAASRWFYIVCFVFFFFFLLVSLSLLRGFVEGFRALVAIPHYSLARPPAPADEGDDSKAGKKKKKKTSDYYLFWRFWYWFLSLRVPLLTWFDTFINLIQGKNQTLTQVFAHTIIEQQRTVVRVANAIRKDLTALIEHELSHSATSLASSVRIAISVLSADQSNVFYISQSPGSAKIAFPRRSVAWVSVVTGKIRWYKHEIGEMPDFDKIVLFDNRKGIIAGDEDLILLTSHLQARNEDYQAFVVLPVPWPQRSYGSDYVKGAIHISFRTDEDFKKIWQPPPLKVEPPPDPPGHPVYPSDQKMLEPGPPPAPAAAVPPAATAHHRHQSTEGGWCQHVEICTALTNSMAILGELLRNFNEVIYKNYIERNPKD